MESQVAPCLKMLPSFAWQKCINLRVNRLDVACDAFEMIEAWEHIQNIQQSSCSAEAVSSHPSKTSPVRIGKGGKHMLALHDKNIKMHQVIMIKPNKTKIPRICQDMSRLIPADSSIFYEPSSRSNLSWFMLHNTFRILKQRPWRSLALAVSTQVVQSIQQPHYRFVQQGGQKQYSMYFSQVVGWQVVSREAVPFPETSWHSSWQSRANQANKAKQIEKNRANSCKSQFLMPNIDLNFCHAWRLLWANRFLGKYGKLHTHTHTHTQNGRGACLDILDLESTCLKWPGCVWFICDDGMLNHT